MTGSVADRVGADLIVVGNRRNHRAPGFVAASLASRLCQVAQTDVLVVDTSKAA